MAKALNILQNIAEKKQAKAYEKEIKRVQGLLHNYFDAKTNKMSSSDIQEVNALLQEYVVISNIEEVQKLTALFRPKESKTSFARKQKSFKRRCPT